MELYVSIPVFPAVNNSSCPQWTDSQDLWELGDVHTTYPVGTSKSAFSRVTLKSVSSKDGRPALGLGQGLMKHFIHASNDALV